MIRHPNKAQVWYLANPYSTPRADNRLVDVKQVRHDFAQEAAVELYRRGYILIEPIAMCHYKSTRYELPAGYQYWKRRDRALIKVSAGVIVLTLDGWQESVGVTDEIQYAKRLGKQVWLLNPHTYAFRRHLGKRPRGVTEHANIRSQI